MKIENVINLVAVAVIAAHIGRKQQLKKDIQGGFAEELRKYKQPKYQISYKKYADTNVSANLHTYGICVETKEDGAKILDKIKDLIYNYGRASVADLYALVGWNWDVQDDKKGWTSTNGMALERERYSWALVFPYPKPLYDAV